MQQFSYHSHTVFSDGINTIEEMLEQAAKIGYKQIGLSDHLVLNEYIKDKTVFNTNPKYAKHHMYLNSFGAETQILLQSHIDQIRKVGEKYDMEVLVGFEVDYFSYDGWEEKFAKLKENLTVDYMLVGNHFCFDKKAKLLVASDYTSNYTQDKAFQKDLIDGYFANFLSSVKSGLFDFVAHLTYIEKCGLCNSEERFAEYRQILKAIKQSGMAIELNTAKNNNPEMFMPTGKVLETARDMDIPILINDDCHDKDKMAIGYAEAEKYLAEIVYTNRWTFTR